MKRKGRHMEFKQLGISTPILKVLQEQSYVTPTLIQEKTIPAALEGNDILGLAQTGTGKTAAFALPTLQILSKEKQNNAKRKIRTLVLTPTRELALQVFESFSVYGKYLPLKSAVIFGGVGQGGQVKSLKSGVDILVATPGRLIDLINQGYIDLSAIEIFILDEADRMLDMGFIHDIRRVMKLLPVKKQTLLFSATMPKEMGSIIDKLLVDPVEVSITPVSSTVDTIKQFVYFVDQKRKINILADFFKNNRNVSVLIFSRTKRGSNRVVRDLGKRGITAQAIHGDKTQKARQNALERFKNMEIQALVATDIASRGIDINELKYVINYDLPETPETYVHRIGRTGRAGNDGIAISFCNFQEKGLLKDIQKLIKKDIEVLENEKYPMVNTTPKEKPQQRRQPSKHKNSKSKNYHSKNKETNKKSKTYNNKNQIIEIENQERNY
ncbi:MAG: DEAD/DEAH box helicase [Coprobacillaceae bacterium]